MSMLEASVPSPALVGTVDDDDDDNNTGRRRFQYYAPTQKQIESEFATTENGRDAVDVWRGGNVKSGSSDLGGGASDPGTGGGRAPDPPDVTAEESAMRVRSRLIQLQHQHRDLHGGGKVQTRRSSDNVGDDEPIMLNVVRQRSRTSSSGVKSELYSQDENNNSDDDEDDDDDYPNMNMEPIESDDEGDVGGPNHFGSEPNSPLQSPKDDSYDVNNHPSSAPVRPSQRMPPQQLMRQLHAGRGRLVNGHLVPPFSGDSGQLPMHHRQPPHQYGESQYTNQTQRPMEGGNQTSSRLYSDGISLLETAAKEARERDEVETLNDSITYLRNLQMGPRKGQHPHPPPPPPQMRPQNRGGEYGNSNNKVGRHHHPPPPRLTGSVPSTPVDNRKGRPIITASAAMDYVMSASARSLGGNNSEEGQLMTQAAADINEMHSFLNTMIREEVGESEAVRQYPKKMGSFESDHGDSEGDDDFERCTSLSLHAEDKYGPGSPGIPSKHAEDKQGPVAYKPKPRGSSDFHDQDTDANIIAQLRSFELEESQPTRNDHSLSDSRLFQKNNRRSQNLDPPDAEDDLKTNKSYDIIVPSVLEKKTVDGSLYAVETVSPTHEDVPDDAGDEVMRPLPKYSRRGTFEHFVPSSKQSSALGPRSSRPGGVTGLSLSGNSDDRRYRLSATEKGHLRTNSSSDKDSQCSLDDSSANAVGDESITDRFPSSSRVVRELDTQSTSLMTKLCAHLLPSGIDDLSNHNDDVLCGVASFFIQNNKHPSWNDDDPDEPGYIVHRLTNAQLNGVESAYEKMITSFGQTSEHDNNFERDLEEAEMILDREEKRYEAELSARASARHSPDSDSNADIDSIDSDGGKAHFGSSRQGSSPGGGGSLDDENSRVDTLTERDEENRPTVPDFPGIYPPGMGKAGEMECFYLPIITRAEKTGFEPTKDLVLKPGTVFANNYLVQGELGSAAFSTAYRCIDLSSEEDEDGYQDEVCLKVIKNTKDYFDQSLDEIKILRMLKETGMVQENNIVEMKSFFYHREHLVIVTELLRQNLYEFGKSILESRGPPYFTRRRLSHITRQCLIALKFVHELGLMHCDIKPEVRGKSSVVLRVWFVRCNSLSIFCSLFIRRTFCWVRTHEHWSK